MNEKIRQLKKYRITQKIFDILWDNNNISIGLTTISLLISKKHSSYKTLLIKHTGNMGNSITRSVDPNLKHIGLPTISELKDIYEVIEEWGGTDYYYSIEFNINIYKS